ncbi:MAG: DUF1343 domain-containing protein [Paludibacteraceae bacterium]|nr:DUF1343 domain-containing protein [Paludibacteraceae bacterium]
MKKIHLILFCTAWVLCSCCNSQSTQNTKKPIVKTGIDVLIEQNFKVLEGKRVGLCTNPTGVNRDLKATIDILNEAPNVNLVALYGPEHGVRGNIYAGDEIETEADEQTGITMYSLFGKSLKPSPEMLEGIDVMVYDIQDNGSRSYTFISTMGKLMEACAENNKELVVLDRPNPLGGKRIEGCLVEEDYVSFISLFPIPYIYGQTCGELALYLNAKRDTPCHLTVIPMEGWTRDMTWDKTGLEWVIASPHIPHWKTCFFYPATGMLGDFDCFNNGVGYTLPFEILGAAWIKDAGEFAKAMNDLNLPGVVFRPLHYNPFFSKGAGTTLEGIQIHITDFEKVQLTDLNFLIIQELMRLYPEENIFEKTNGGKFRMFDLACGTGYIREHFSKNYRWDDVKDYWYKDVETYRQESSKYYLYK